MKGLKIFMLDDKDLLELCLKVTGSFESGTPRYDQVTGNFDGKGLSIGVLQWNAGTGGLQHLLLNIGGKMGWEKAQSFFVSDVHHLAVLSNTDAVKWCLDHYIKAGSTDVDSSAKERWQNFLNQPESVAAQVEMAANGVLFRAKTLAQQFCPNAIDRTRVISFFFDLVTQSGGMQNSRGKVVPWTAADAPSNADGLAFTNNNSPKTAGIWETILPHDDLAKLLLYYAFERSKLSDPRWIWDAFSRRGTIACRGGVVHSTKIDLTGILD